MTDEQLVLGKETLKIVKALANENRFKILDQLYVEPLTFKKLKEYIGLEKSALANNLNILINVDLVEKSQHGIYVITDDGKKLLEEDSYRHPHLRHPDADWLCHPMPASASEPSPLQDSPDTR